MGLFNKLKNALFEEDIEVPIETNKVEKPKEIVEEKKGMAPVEEKKEIKKPNVFLEEENERELFKAENTFKFPDFDEEEFQSSYKQPPLEKEEKEEYITPKERFDRVKPITYEYDKKTKPIHKETKVEKVEEPKKKVFKPSPVISPVYGVLDKNYKKEDIVTIQKEEEKPKKKFDLDAIRKKAFGTLEDDIESTFDSPKEDFYNNKKTEVEKKKSSIEDTLEVPKLDSRVEKRSERHQKDYEEKEIENYPYPEEVEEPYQNEEPTKQEKKFEEDTLENDLFDLIDSMYDNREEEE